MHWAEQPDAVIIALLVGGRDTLLPHDRRAGWTSWLRHSESQRNGTLSWSDEEQEPLEATHCHALAGEHGRRLYQQVDSVLKPLEAHEPYRRLIPTDARGSGSTDALGRNEASGRVHAIALAVTAHAIRPAPRFVPLLLPLPFLRQAYHGACSVAEIEGGGGEGGGGEGDGVELRALHSLSAGEEVTLDAHGSDVASLMIRQGDPGIHPRDLALAPGTATAAASSSAALAAAAAASVRLSVSMEVGDGPLGALKQLVLSKASLRAEGQAFTLKGGVPPRFDGGPGFRAALPPKLMPYARLAVLQEHEEALLPTRGAADQLPMAPLSEENEEHAFRWLASKLELLLAAYPTTQEEDEYELLAEGGGGGARGGMRRGAAATSAAAAARSTRRAAATAAALLEKRVLTSTLGTLHADVLDYQEARGHRPKKKKRRRKKSRAKEEL